MKKIPTIFVRNPQNRGLVTDEVNPEASWVFRGEGVATRKWDGTCCMIRDGKLFKRYDAKHGKAPPAGFEPAQEPDTVTGHWLGWLPVGDGPEDVFHREAMGRLSSDLVIDGTYELCGPKVQGNPEGFPHHALIPHGKSNLGAPRYFNDLKEWFTTQNIEGVVWHHADGRMAKIKKKDFGFKR